MHSTQTEQATNHSEYLDSGELHLLNTMAGMISEFLCCRHYPVFSLADKIIVYGNLTNTESTQRKITIIHMSLKINI